MEEEARDLRSRFCVMDLQFDRAVLEEQSAPRSISRELFGLLQAAERRLGCGLAVLHATYYFLMCVLHSSPPVPAGGR